MDCRSSATTTLRWPRPSPMSSASTRIPKRMRRMRRAAIEAGCHVFCEKPLAETVEEAQSIVDAAVGNGRKLVIGYILRVHPAWIRFIEIARTLGQAAGHADEPEPAEPRPDRGTSTAT